MDEQLTVGSLFSGIGGFDLGLERAGMRTVWFCEKDEFCRRVLAKHWPDVPCHRDIVELRHPERVDVLCGGFPCQDISSAGKGAGLAGARSGLWREFARLVGELRPRYVIVENVPPLRKKGLDQVLEDLDACGYDAEWDGISASAVGAPHRRDRIWLVAYPNGEGEHDGAVDAEMAGAPQPLANSSWDLQAGTAPAGAERERTRASGERSRARGMGNANGSSPDTHATTSPPWTAIGERGWWSVEPDVGRVADGVPARVDRLRSLGNALVPQIAEFIGRRILDWERANVLKV